jgi:fructose-1,6-bisphosphatase/sedoheptulose 1,7-bisphosphatase-like protein
MSAKRSRAIGVASDRNLAMELVRVTEGAAIAAARLMGRNAKEEADQANSPRRCFVDRTPCRVANTN